MNKEPFDQKKYIREYSKNHYSTFSTKISHELLDDINKYCNDMGITKAEFLRRAIRVLDDYGEK